MELRQLEAFVEVASRRSFSRAAEYLLLNQSTVSSHIKNLEQELGRQLILRNSKPLMLTPDGESFYWYAKRIVDTRNSALNVLNQSQKTTIHVGASSIPSVYLLPKYIAEYQKIAVSQLFQIRQSNSLAIRDMLLDGVIDLGFVGKDCSGGNCRSIALRGDELVLVTPATKEYRELRASHASLQTLMGCPFVSREYGSGIKFIPGNVMEKLGLEHSSPNVIVQTNDLESMKQMVVAGIGVTICSRMAVSDLAAQGAVFLYDLPHDTSRHFYLIYNAERHLKPAAQQFTDYIIREYGPK